jgi:hypothetical protein
LSKNEVSTDEGLCSSDSEHDFTEELIIREQFRISKIFKIYTSNEIVKYLTDILKESPSLKTVSAFTQLFPNIGNTEKPKVAKKVIESTPEHCVRCHKEYDSTRYNSSII